MSNFEDRPVRAWRLLNEVPFDGCLLVFNAVQRDFRAKASDFKRQHGFAFKIHAITGADRKSAHSREVLSDLYITLKE